MYGIHTWCLYAQTHTCDRHTETESPSPARSISKPGRSDPGPACWSGGWGSKQLLAPHLPKDSASG